MLLVFGLNEVNLAEGKTMTSDTIRKAIQQIGPEQVRKIVYGETVEHEYIGMQKFVDSRQDWCKQGILDKLEAIINR